MKLKEIIRKIFRPNLSPDIHKTLVCGTIDDFFKVVRATSEYDRKSVYVYKGKASVLAAIVGSKYGMGEKDISPLSLLYADVDTSKKEVGDCIYLDEPFLEPCNVADLKPRDGRFDECKRIRFENGPRGHYVEIKQAVICHNGVYLTTK